VDGRARTCAARIIARRGARDDAAIFSTWFSGFRLKIAAPALKDDPPE